MVTVIIDMIKSLSAVAIPYLVARTWRTWRFVGDVPAIISMFPTLLLG